MPLLTLLTFFIIWRSFDFLIAYLAPSYISYLGHFSYQLDLIKSKLPAFIYSWANFDGMFMLRISQKGYQQFEQAFFPFYPLLIRWVYQLTHVDRIIVGLLISNLTLIIGLYLLTKYFNKQKNVVWIILFILAFPTSFYFGALYSESLFFMLVISCFYFLKKNNIIMTFIVSYLAALTRFQGILLIIPITIYLISNNLLKLMSSRVTSPQAGGRGDLDGIASPRRNIEVRNDKVSALLFFAPLLGLGTYMIFLASKFNKPLMFLTSHTFFGQGRSGGIILLPQVYYRYLKIILFANHDFAYFRALFEVTSFTIVASILLYMFYRLYKQGKLLSSQSGLVLFSIAYLLMPTISGTFLSIPRMVILCLPFFNLLADIKNIKLKFTLLIIFYLLHIVTLGYFIQGYFIS